MIGLFSVVVFTVMVLLAVFFWVPPAEGMGYLVRIVYFHVPCAWVSVLAFFISAGYAAAYLRSGRKECDKLSARSAKIGFVFVLLATFSGAVFSKLTWGAYWNWDPRQTTIFILILIYGAYLTLRSSLPEKRKAKASAVYSLFSCLTVPFLFFVIPRFYFSLHPEPIINMRGSIDMEPLMFYILIAALIDATLIYFYLLKRTAPKDAGSLPPAPPQAPGA